MAILLVLCLILGFILYKFSTRNFDYWKKRGVPYVEPSPIFGNFLEVFLCRTTIGHVLVKFYEQFKSARYFGAFVMNTPHLIVKDPELIKTILVKDFNYFYDRTIVSDEKCDALGSKFLFLLKNPEWKYTRTKMTPAFTTGKLKSMMDLIKVSAEEMVNYLGKHLENRSIETKEVCAKYSTDVIASTAFGIHANSFVNENAEFRVISRKMFNISLGNSIRQACYFIAPSIVKLTRMPFFDPSITKFMREVFWKTIDEREKGNYRRNDLIDIIIQLKKEGVDERFEFVGDRVVAQAGQFYAAGFETVSSTLSFCLYEICLHQDIQSKLRAEIKSVLSERGTISYEAVQDMKYLHMNICETLRKYPVLPFLDRMCAEDYKIPGSDLVIEKGTPVFIPMFGLHYDKEYFPDPDKYDPERFSELNKSKLPPFTYIPFGEGPRICLGERYGLMVVKLGLIQILQEYQIERSVDTPVPLVYEPRGILLASKVGLPIKFRKLASKAA